MKTKTDDLINPTYSPSEVELNKGLTKREYFAAMAMQGICVQAIAGSHNINNISNNVEKARHAADLADALINALNQTK